MDVDRVQILLSLVRDTRKRTLHTPLLYTCMSCSTHAHRLAIKKMARKTKRAQKQHRHMMSVCVSDALNLRDKRTGY